MRRPHLIISGEINHAAGSEMRQGQALGSARLRGCFRIGDYTDKCSDTGCALCHYRAMETANSRKETVECFRAGIFAVNH